MKQYIEIIKQLTLKIEELESLNEVLKKEVDEMTESLKEIYS